MTNGDIIRAMSDEELIKVIKTCKFCIYHNTDCRNKTRVDCHNGTLAGLKKEVKND